MSKRTITEIIKQLKEKKLSAKKLYHSCWRRAEVLSELNCFVTKFDTEKSNADEIDQRISKGERVRLLEGIPVAFKDNFSTRDVETTCASKTLLDYRPPYTATVVQRMLNQGAVSMGKLNMDEFAMGTLSDSDVHGPVRNPWRYPLQCSAEIIKKKQTDTDNEEYINGSDWFISGGSSGGSAVAVAVGACFASLGSDTGGSVRVPSSFCGVVGYKPTYGLLSRYGLIPLVHSLDCPGIITRYVDDTAQVLNAIGGHDPLDSTSDPRHFQQISLPEVVSVQQLHVGIPKEFHSPYTTNDVLKAWSKCIDMLDAAGARISEVSLPNHQYGISCYNILNTVEVASNMSIYDGVEFGHRSLIGESMEELFAETRHESFNNVVRGRILCGNYFLLKEKYETYFEQAMKVRRMICNDFEKVFSIGVDVLLVPTVDCTAMSYKDCQTNSENYTWLDNSAITSNLAGLPAISIPVCLSSDGLPIGLQVIAARFSDENLLTTAKWIEDQFQFPYHVLDEKLMMFEDMLTPEL